MLSVSMLVSLATSLLKGPVAAVIDRYVSDLELRRKLKAELEQGMLDHATREAELGTSIVLAETNSEHWLTRSWRPLMMLVLLGFLVLVGVGLPFADWLSGHTIKFNPRWSALPPEFWNFISIGMGGYIGGRSLEKIAGGLRR